jgi:outer membrane protein insertion porin family
MTPVRIFFSLIVSGILLAGISGASAQSAPIVKEIAVEYVGAPSISRERVLANLATQVGQPYSERAAENDIRNLYTTGGVANVRIFAEPLGDGVKVTVLLQGRPVIEEILIEGAEQIPMNRVRREIGSKVGDVLSEERLEEDRQKILTGIFPRWMSSIRFKKSPGQTVFA